MKIQNMCVENSECTCHVLICIFSYAGSWTLNIGQTKCNMHCAFYCSFQLNVEVKWNLIWSKLYANWSHTPKHIFKRPPQTHLRSLDISDIKLFTIIECKYNLQNYCLPFAIQRSVTLLGSFYYFRLWLRFRWRHRFQITITFGTNRSHKIRIEWQLSLTLCPSLLCLGLL